MRFCDGGLRCCELARLRVEDYDADRASVVVRGKAYAYPRYFFSNPGSDLTPALPR